MGCEIFEDLEVGMSRTRRLGKWNRFVMDCRQGWADHFPICCILRFSIEDALGDGKTQPINEGMAVKRGCVVRADLKDVFVPCNIFHHKTEDFYQERPMIFCNLALSEDGVVTASAKGHGDEVLQKFHAVAQLLLGSRGSWRITDVVGTCAPEDVLDSDMRWTLIAKSKDRGV